MPTTRTSTARDSDRPFRSRFADGEDLFPLRQYLRARDELVHRLITAVILTGFGVALLLFGRSVHHMIARHGNGGAAWLEPAAWAVIGLALAVTVRRIWRHGRAIAELRAEMRISREHVRELRDRA